MESELMVWLLVIFSTISVCHCVEGNFSIAVHINDEEVSVSIGDKEFPNPCNMYRCPEGKICTVQYTPRLLKIPIAHCVWPASATKPDEGACIEHTVATTILKCKSEDQWRAVGIIQCSLRNSVATNLISTEVKHVCPGKRVSGRVTFLAASFNCCPNESESASSGTNIIFSSQINSTDVIKGDLKADENDRSKDFIIVIVMGGTVTLVVSLILIALKRRCQQKNASLKHKPDFIATSIINPHVDNSGDQNSSDKSLLIFNEHVSPQDSS